LPKILWFNFNRFTMDYTTFSRIKINDKVTFPLLLNMNVFLQEYTDESIQKLMDSNPLSKVRPSDLKLSKFSSAIDENEKDKEEIMNDTKKRYHQFMENELQNLEDQGEFDAEGQVAIQRRKKMEEEQKLHKENLKKLKKGIKNKRTKFNPRTMNSNFFANAKKATNAGTGWAMEFGVEDSWVVAAKPKNSVALPGEGSKLMEERKRQISERPQQTENHQGSVSKETEENAEEEKGNIQKMIL
jgi:hypothetical protein